MVSTSKLKAMEIILSPCCGVRFESVGVTCDLANAGKYVVTFKLTEPLNLRGKGTFGIVTNSSYAVSTAGGFFPWNDSNTISVDNLSLGVGPGTVSYFNVQFFIADNFDPLAGTSGGFILATALANSVVIPTC